MDKLVKLAGGEKELAAKQASMQRTRYKSQDMIAEARSNDGEGGAWVTLPDGRMVEVALRK